MFDRELAAFTVLDQHGGHNNILKCFGSFVQHDATGLPTFNLLLEYADWDLMEYFAGTPPPTSREETMQVWKQISQVADGVRALHSDLEAGSRNRNRTIYHLDLKPENILVFEKAQTWKIADFGFTKLVDFDGGRPPNQHADGGTPMYSKWNI